MTRRNVIVIGAGPAGLMAAEVAARAGLSVLVLEAKATPARKFLMAGKSGLNLTKDEPFAAFLARYDAPDWLRPMLAGFDNQAVMDWARGLGTELFSGTTGRVFPVEMKASRLLRAWLARLAELGVDLRARHRMMDFGSGFVVAEAPGGPLRLEADHIVLALGGASWPRLGSDGTWADLMREKGVAVTPLQPSNAGLSVAWSSHMARHFGQPVKGVALTCGDQHSRGEFVVTAKGLEGGGIYEVNAGIRGGAPLILDLLPGVSAAEATERFDRTSHKDSLPNRLRKALKLDPVKVALFLEFSRNRSVADLKTLQIQHQSLRPLTEAISTAGGVARTELTGDLMLKALPGVHVTGEMIDWDAPTGGYLLTACLATGAHVGRAIAGTKPDAARS